mmetsp:Transcript_27259/g.65894  ORF Transcript_27259/g.65894 Transcript_27259/m.65894 type:complete len:335 (+) Transcript_27259:66-1070(+)
MSLNNSPSKRVLGSMDENDAKEMIQLVPCGAGKVTHVPLWEKVAADQGAVTSTALKDSVIGQCFALEDRNCMSMAWRRVYAIRVKDHFAIYSAKGLVMNEASQGLPDGLQPVEELLDEFTEEGFYYRPPKSLRHEPRKRRLTEDSTSINTVDDAQLVDANDVMDAGPAAPASADSAVLAAEAPAVGTDVDGRSTAACTACSHHSHTSTASNITPAVIPVLIGLAPHGELPNSTSAMQACIPKFQPVCDLESRSIQDRPKRGQINSTRVCGRWYVHERTHEALALRVILNTAQRAPISVRPHSHSVVHCFVSSATSSTQQPPARCPRTCPRRRCS